jgi:alanyl-tRNA synthetase
VSSTARRIEALVGSAAVADFSVERSITRELTQLLKTPREELPQRIEELLGQVKHLERQLAKNAQAVASSFVPSLLEKAQDVAGLSAVVHTVTEQISADDLRSLASQVLAGLGEGASVVVLANQSDGRGAVIVAANKAAVGRGVHSGELVKIASGAMGGGGGGKPGLAQGGGPDASQLGAAMELVVGELGRL